MFVLLIGMLALLNTAAVVVDHNLFNVFRDEATGVAEESMNSFRNNPFTSLIPGTYGSTLGSAPPITPNVTRTIRGITVNYSVTTVITQPDITNPNTLTIQVTVQWTHKGIPTLHSISSVVNNVI